MKTLVWDVDDVLNDLMRSWLAEAWLPAHPDCRVTYEQIAENPPHRVLGVSKEEYLASLDAYRAAPAAGRLRPSAEVLAWLGRHGDRFRHIALTARPLASAGSTAEWVYRCFGAWIRTFSVVPARLQPGLPPLDRTKKEFLQWLGKADVFIDDSPENVLDACSLGMRGIVFPQPWNHSPLTPAEALDLLSATCA